MGSQLEPLALLLTLALGVALLAAPRRFALLPILAGAIFIPADQRVVIATLDFSMIRILILFAFARVIGRGEIRPIQINALDIGIVALAVIFLVTQTLLYQTLPAFVNRLGTGFDLLGIYFYTRLLLMNWTDMWTTVRLVGWCLGIFAVFMAIEWTTGRNLFSAIGGVPEYTVVRDGRLRCQGAIAHPILAGVFGACWTPIVFSLWWKKEKSRAVLSYLGAFFVVVFSASSTPLLALVFGALALCLWPLRTNLRWLRWAGLALIIFLHLVREKPVWHLLARINVVGGSTGYHRYLVIDKAIQYFDEWWMLGTTNIDHWRIHANDITNQYVATGINGGIVAMFMLIGIIVIAFRLVGRSFKSRYLSPPQRRFAWTLGATHFTHTAIFFAVAYFGQLTFIWYLQMALVGALAEITERQTKGLRRRKSKAPPADDPATPPVLTPAPGGVAPRTPLP
ncbi:MAG: hypothetical protein AAF430_21790 [Myxococcota bacterium]